MSNREASKIQDLKTKWEEEKNYYRAHEVGTGVHSFVKDVLLSKQLFGLAEGKGSTSDDRRTDEFIHERRAKERQPDFVIYITPEIVIPIEVETYGNIKAGLSQLAEYQRILEKKYGILTDGYTWQFYNNDLLDREFNIDAIFDDTSSFLTFWKEYVKPENYYLSFFGKMSKGLFVEQNRLRFFAEITSLIENFKSNLQVEGYFKGLDENTRKKKATEISYAYIIQFILYKTLVDNDFGDFSRKFNESVKKIGGYIKNKRYKDVLGTIEGISVEISRNIYRPFVIEQEFISKKILELYRVENKLADVSPWLDIFVFIMKYNFQNIQGEIFGYVYENYLKELFEESQQGQYFTDPAVVDFMLKHVGYTADEIKPKIERGELDTLSIIDPACGSGTFLYSATDEIVKSFQPDSEETSKRVEEIVTQNVFGLDIAEFPLYLAEMNILMRILPFIMAEEYINPFDEKLKLFLTMDSINEFLDSAIGKTEVTFTPELEPDYESFMREPKDIQEMKGSLEEHRKIPRRRFDYVVANPPYITYNDCSKQGLLSFKKIKKGELKLNNVYGVNLHSTPQKTKRYRPNPNLYAFFVALGIALLKTNGKLCFIVPQTLLTAGDLDVIRYHLAQHVTLEKLFTFRGKLFIERGLKQKKRIPTSSLIFVLNPNRPRHGHKVEIVNYLKSDDSIAETMKNISKQIHTNRKEILQSELLEETRNWNFIKQSQSLIDLLKAYKENSENFSSYYVHALSEPKFKSVFIFDSGYSIDEKQTSDKPIPNVLNYRFPRLDESFYTVREFLGYWPNIREPKHKYFIKLRHANQGYMLLDSTYKIVWSYINPKLFHFTDKPVIWARNRFCAIGSENESELFYISALLNSKINWAIIRSYLESEAEKDLLVSTSSLKEYIRIPKINKANQAIKDEIIEVTRKTLSLEKKSLSDFVDFSGLMIQKFDEVKIEKGNLMLVHDGKKVKLRIKSNSRLISETIKSEFGQRDSAQGKNKIRLSYLRALSVIDSDSQEKLKAHIDDLVFALYFNIPFKAVDLKNPEKVKRACQKNRFYKILGE